MNKAKRIIVAFLAFAMLICFASCVKTDKPFSRGVVDGDTYTSEFLGLTFTKPSNWKFLSDEEIKTAFNLSSQVFDNPEFIEKAEEATTVDFFAVGPDSSNINIGIVKAKTKVDLISSVKKTFDDTAKIYRDSGWYVVIGETEDVLLGNIKTKRVIVNITTDLNSKMTQYNYCFAFGNYYVTVCCTSVTNYKAEDFEAMFS